MDGWMDGWMDGSMVDRWMDPNKDSGFETRVLNKGLSRPFGDS